MREKKQVWRRCFAPPKPSPGPPQSQVKLLFHAFCSEDPKKYEDPKKVVQPSKTFLPQGRRHGAQNVLESSQAGGDFSF